MQTHHIIEIGYKVGRLFVINQFHILSIVTSFTQLILLSIWNSHLGHASMSRLKFLVDSAQLSFVFSICLIISLIKWVKEIAFPFYISNYIAFSPFGLFIMTFRDISIMYGCHYFVIFVYGYLDLLVS